MAGCVSGRELPRVELYPEESVSVQLGGSALFQCRIVGGSPAPTVVWSRCECVCVCVCVCCVRACVCV